jgi:hypothetical protein
MAQLSLRAISFDGTASRPIIQQGSKSKDTSLVFFLLRPPAFLWFQYAITKPERFHYLKKAL